MLLPYIYFGSASHKSGLKKEGSGNHLGYDAEWLNRQLPNMAHWYAKTFRPHRMANTAHGTHAYTSFRTRSHCNAAFLPHIILSQNVTRSGEGFTSFSESLGPVVDQSQSPRHDHPMILPLPYSGTSSTVWRLRYNCANNLPKITYAKSVQQAGTCTRWNTHQAHYGIGHCAS